MLPNECHAIDRCMLSLVEALKHVTPIFLHHLESNGVIKCEERELIERANTISAQQLNHLFYILKWKDSGWSQILFYLRDNDQCCLADRLCQCADMESDEFNSKRPRRSSLEEFSYWLAQFYQRNYADVPTVGQSPKHVKNVWVPLKMDGRLETHLEEDPIDHIELLSRLHSDDRRYVALIKGDPGMGKTTIVKKIAYDWAINYGANEAQQFSLVLAVPLGSAGKSDRFDLLAVDYFLSIIDMEGINRDELVGEIKQLKSRLLVILDGLDEYTSYRESPFNTSFAAPFEQSTTNCSVPLQMISFKLIITSRPYASHFVKKDFPLLKFVIMPLSENHLSEFVRLYCETPHGIHKVTEYLKTNAQMVIQVPLILTFVCFLADSVQEIPTNMTSLYDTFILQMIIRENQSAKLAESVNLEKWRDSNLVKATADLAYRYPRSSTFLTKHMKKCKVTNDSFVCGFLLHKFEIVKDRRVAEFPHRSIREFFTALHCRQILFGSGNDLVAVTKLLCGRDSQVGRFLFGICSLEGKLTDLTNVLTPHLLYSKNVGLDPISLYGCNVMDCSSDGQRNIGQMLFESFGVKHSLTANWKTHREDYNKYKLLHVDQFSEEFKQALHMQFPVVTRISQPPGYEKLFNWILVDNEKVARLMYVWGKPDEDFPMAFLVSLFTKFDTLIWRYRGPEMQKTFDGIKVLVPVSTFVMKHGDSATRFCISYGQKTDVILTQFEFNYHKGYRDELWGLLGKEKLKDLTVDEQFEYKIVGTFGEALTFRHSRVTVNDQSITQSELIFSLIHLALQ